jgi:hypothetical protein
MKKIIIILTIMLGLCVAFASADCTGGTITTDGSFMIHTFLESGTLTCSESLRAEVLAVAGGGAGFGGGGGAGGLLHEESYTILAGDNPVVVGDGGLAEWDTDASHGKDSIFGTLHSIGGGGMNMTDSNGEDGGSGQGGPTGGLYAFGHGIPGQGHDGGQGNFDGFIPAGGGGGAGGVGETAPDGDNAGDGGPGITYDISGVDVCYAGGGGGAFHYADNGTVGVATCGGGNGSTTLGVGNPGVDGTGGGGGGGPYEGSATVSKGGDGIIIIRYLRQTSSNAASIVAATAGSAGRTASTSGFGVPQIIGLVIIGGIVIYNTGLLKKFKIKA